MMTINRLYCLNSERKETTFVKNCDRSFDSIRSFKVKHKRENCVLGDVVSPGETY